MRYCYKNNEYNENGIKDVKVFILQILLKRYLLDRDTMYLSLTISANKYEQNLMV